MLALIGTNGQGIGTSSFSKWVKNVTALNLPEEQSMQIDKLIDKTYEEMDEGNSYPKCQVLKWNIFNRHTTYIKYMNFY